MSHERITLDDTGITAAVKLSEGNPGAVTVCGLCLRDGGTIDPDGALGGLGVLMGLDTLGIYGDRIWLLYKDICGESVRNVCMLIRAWQMGFLPRTRLVAAINCQRDPRFPAVRLDMDDLNRQVEESLPAFQKAKVAV